MTNPGRPGPPHAAPRGHRWVPDYADRCEPIDTDVHRNSKCLRKGNSLRRNNLCHANGVASVNEVPVCANHLAREGMWVDAGIVLRWALEPVAEEE